VLQTVWAKQYHLGMREVGMAARCPRSTYSTTQTHYPRGATRWWRRAVVVEYREAKILQTDGNTTANAPG
jgi:hypothetical protein